MADDTGAIGLIVCTLFYLAIALIGYFVTPKGPNRG